MANVNGNNIDDLFKQASENYPLRTDSADWGKLAADLGADPSLASLPAAEKRDRRRRYLWLLLLLPLAGLGYLTWQGNALHRQQNAAYIQSSSGQNQQNVSLRQGVQASDSKKDGNSNIKANSIPAADTKPVGQGKSSSELLQGSPIAAGGIKETAGQTKARQNEVTAGQTKTGQVMVTAGQTASIQHGFAGHHGASSETNGASGSGARGGTTTGGVDLQRTDDIQKTGITARPILTGGDIAVLVDVRAPQQQANSSKNQTPKKIEAPHRGLYVGLMGAPDLSTIAFQSVKKPGWTFSFLAGYAFNPRWSIETGLSVDKKNYYTDGDDFNKENIPNNQYEKLNEIKGNCHMLEIPLNLRYNLSTGPIHTWFATAGLSSYLMTSEWYTYSYWWTNNPNLMNRSFTDTKPYNYFFSVVDLSVGYEQKLGKIGNLRLEPYVRVPLSGIGTGGLSILSAGLNMGITRRIW